jgi:hypothetical protein
MYNGFIATQTAIDTMAMNKKIAKNSLINWQNVLLPNRLNTVAGIQVVNECAATMMYPLFAFNDKIYVTVSFDQPFREATLAELTQHGAYL